MIDLNQLEKELDDYHWSDVANEELLRELVARLRKAETGAAWVSADTPPPGRPGLWSPEVVAITSLGNVLKLSYFHGDENGVWQRPKSFADGEKVEWWLPLPK